MSTQNSALQDLRIERPDKERSSAGVRIFLLIMVLVGAAAAGFWWWRNQTTVIEVHTAVVRELSSGGGLKERTILNASGYVTARREATVSSKITGKVTEVFVEEGMKIKQGQIVARLDDTNVTTSLQLALAQLEATKAALAETRIRLNEADKQFRRQAQLTTKRMAPQSEYDQSEAQVLSWKAKLQQQQAEIVVAEKTVNNWRQQAEDTIIRAPFSGIVTSKNAQPGEMISPMSAGGSFTRTGICTIVDMESLEIEIDVNESYINRVQPGQPVEATLDAYPDWKIPCKVIAIIPTADRQKSTVRVRVAFLKLDPRILPEMSVKVAFQEAAAATTATADATTPTRRLIVPKEAVFKEEGRDVIFVIGSGRAERRAVSAADTTQDEVILIAGASPGERVAVDRPQGLADGVAVKDLDK